MQFAKTHIARKFFLYLRKVIAKVRVAGKIFLLVFATQRQMRV